MKPQADSPQHMKLNIRFNSKMNCWGNYYIYKWAKEVDTARERKKSEKSLKKFRKKYMISEYGYDYYLRDETWKKIKDQKKKETYEIWKKRLALYGFTVQGFDTRRNEQHFDKPLVHEYNFYDQLTSIDISEKEEDNTMNNLTWESILISFTENPRDVLTRKNGVWFYTFGDGKNVYVEAGKNHKNCSKITIRRRLDCENFENIFYMYVNNTPRSDLLEITRNSSYWFGIFSDLLNNK
ncbi:MAG: hypothetical protein IJW52_05695 [Clostridia bacterium]|nr:hypothetical protein [Clostridia bacterium]